MFLEGLRILDLSRVLAGPYATQILADMGAEVLKVESPRGDDTRAWGPPFQAEMSAYYQSCNRNKASLVLDLKSTADHGRLMDLVEKADCVVDNFTEPVRQRLGLASAALRRRRADLIHLSIIGFRGDRVAESGYDIMVQAESGLMAITGPKDGEPFKVGVALVDVMTGMMAANGVLAALWRRERTGQGAELSVSLYQTALSSLVNVASNYLVSGQAGARWGNEHPNIVPYQSFQLADRPIIIAVGNDDQFRRLCALLAIADPAFLLLSNAERVARRGEVIAVLAQRLGGWRSDELLALLKAEKIPAAPILRPEEALVRVQRWDPSAILALDHDQLGRVNLIANPILAEGMRAQHTPPPRLGEGGEALARAWLCE